MTKPTRTQVEKAAREMYASYLSLRIEDMCSLPWYWRNTNANKRAEYRKLARWHLARIVESRSADEVIIRALHVELANRRKIPRDQGEEGEGEMSYSPQTLEMVARRAYAAMFPLVADDHPPLPETQNALIRIARWHLDEIGGVLGYADDRRIHNKYKAHKKSIAACPHCAKTPTPTDPNEMS